MSSQPPANSDLDIPSTIPFKDISTTALVVSEANAPFILQPIILDAVRPNELLIDMKYSGICHSDIMLQQNGIPGICEYPAVFGHEGAGTIVEIGTSVKDKSLRIGDSVLLSFNTCGSCRQCNAGHPSYCHNHQVYNLCAVRQEDGSTPARLAADGTSVRSQFFGHSSFARKSIVKEKCVVKLDEKYKDFMELYAPLGCGFQTGCGTVLNVLKPPKDGSIVIFGLGSVGLAALMGAKYLGVREIIGVDVVDAKLEMAVELGATKTINSLEVAKSGAEGGVVAAIQKATMSGEGPLFAVDCTGILPVIEDMVECLGPMGTATIVGVPPAYKKLQIDPLQFFLKNKRLVAVVEGDSVPQQFIPELVRMHQEGNFPIEKLCKTYPVEKVEEAIRDMHNGKVVKPVLSWLAQG